MLHHNGSISSYEVSQSCQRITYSILYGCKSGSCFSYNSPIIHSVQAAVDGGGHRNGEIRLPVRKGPGDISVLVDERQSRDVDGFVHTIRDIVHEDVGDHNRKGQCR